MYIHSEVSFKLMFVASMVVAYQASLPDLTNTIKNYVNEVLDLKFWTAFQKV